MSSTVSLGTGSSLDWSEPFIDSSIFVSGSVDGGSVVVYSSSSPFVVYESFIWDNAQEGVSLGCSGSTSTFPVLGYFSLPASMYLPRHFVCTGDLIYFTYNYGTAVSRIVPYDVYLRGDIDNDMMYLPNVELFLGFCLFFGVFYIMMKWFKRKV